MNILIIACGSEKVGEIEQALLSFDIGSKLCPLSEFNTENLALYDGIIISGAPILLTSSSIKLKLLEFNSLWDFHKPVLGICYGHQILGLKYGAEIGMGDEDRSNTKVEKVINSPLFKGLESSFTMREDHCEFISVPEGFELIATSGNCKNEAMQHRSKPLFGVQFHPEVSGDNGYLLLKNFCELCEA